MELSLSLKKNIKNKLFQLIILFLIISIVKNPSMALNSAKSGLYLWFNVLVPSLLPFLILSELFISSGLIKIFGRLLEPIMKPIFRISGEGSFPFVMSLVSGYPMGAKLTSRLRSLNIISREEGNRLITLASTSGPLFILGSVLVGMLALPNLGGLIIIPHYLSVITVGLIFSYLPNKSINDSNKRFSSANNNKNNRILKTDSIPVIIANSVRDSINSILIIGGFVIIYNVIIDILLDSHVINILIIYFSKTINLDLELIKGILAGFIELTTGCNRIAILDIKIIVKIMCINFLIGWGGLSILSQAISFISQTDMSTKKYILSKFLHGIISAIYTYVLYLIYYKDYLIPSYLNNIVREEIYSYKNWFDNIYFSTKISIGICVFFIILSIFVHNICSIKKDCEIN